VGRSTVGDGLAVAVAMAVEVLSGVEEAESSGVFVAVTETGSFVGFTATLSRLHADATSIRINPNITKALFFFMGGLLAGNYPSF
jgi:translation elongation factor EF-4